MEYDYVIAGAGLSGSVFAREMAEKGFRVLLLERRNHIAGNLYDERDSSGFIVHRYGPHIFHTSDEKIHQYVHKFSEWNDYRLRCEVMIDGVSTPSPFNFKTIDQLYSIDKAKQLKDILLTSYPHKKTVTVVELLESKNSIIKAYAQMLFDKDYSLYTAKQWGVSPQDIDPSVLKRVPIRLDYEEQYFTDSYEYLPRGTYTEFIANILDHMNITVKKNTNVLEHIKVDMEKRKILFSEKLMPSKDCVLVFTGAIDELFRYQYGRLPYRSLKFKYSNISVDDFQSAAVVAYPSAPDYTRVTEYTKLPFQVTNGKTIVAFEYPIPFKEGNGTEPFYPIPTEESKEQYMRYKQLADTFGNLVLCGRLAEYKYYNMDQAVASVLSKINKL